MRINELFNDPYYWNNNKRRYNGLKPIRNNKRRIEKIIHNVELFDAISNEIDAMILTTADEIFSKLVDIKDINTGDII